MTIKMNQMDKKGKKKPAITKIAMLFCLILILFLLITSLKKNKEKLFSLFAAKNTKSSLALTNESSNYILNGIIYDNEDSYAIINGILVKKNDKINNFVIKKISSQRVDMIDLKNNTRLKLRWRF